MTLFRWIGRGTLRSRSGRIASIQLLGMTVIFHPLKVVKVPRLELEKRDLSLIFRGENVDPLLDCFFRGVSLLYGSGRLLSPRTDAIIYLILFYGFESFSRDYWFIYRGSLEI
jgi:hypothetical protein